MKIVPYYTPGGLRSMWENHGKVFDKQVPSQCPAREGIWNNYFWEVEDVMSTAVHMPVQEVIVRSREYIH